MVLFVAGFGCVFAVLCGVAIYTEAQELQTQLFDAIADDWQPLAAMLFALPVAAAWLTLEVLHCVRPCRWFDHRVKHRVKLLGLGVIAGMVAAAESTFLLAWGEDFVPAWVIVPLCTVLAVAGAFMTLPRVRPGFCIHCGYDIHDGGLAGRCSECGSLDPL